jgi:hypothetical protein
MVAAVGPVDRVGAVGRRERDMRFMAATAERPKRTQEELFLESVLLLAAASALCIACLFLSALWLGVIALLAAGGYGVLSYLRNESHQDLPIDLGTAWDAAIDALGENGFIFEEPTWHGATEGALRAGDAKVIVERHPGFLSRVRVRVGLLDTADNRRRAALVLESLERLAGGI